MALSGSLQTNVETKYNSYGRYYVLSWTAAQSVAGNSSEVTWTLSAASSQGSSAWVAERTLIAVIDGETVVSKSNRVERYPGVIASGKKTLTHNSDGTRSFAMSINTAAYGSEITCSASGRATLDPIARASDLTVGDGTLGSALTITASRKSSGFTHTVAWKCGSDSGTIADKSAATSWSFTPAVSLASNAPNSTLAECGISLTTYNNSAEVGTVKKAIHLSIPSSVKPSCTLTLSDPTGYAATYGGYVKGKSKIKAVVGASGAHGSTIKSYSVSANGSSYSEPDITTDVVKTVGTNTVSAAVTDSRGRSGSANGSVTVIDYAEPRITKLSVNRCNADGSSNQSGSYVKVTYSFSIYPLSGKNGKTITLKYKKTSESSYTNIALPSAYSATDATNVFAADDGSAYDVSIIAADAFGSAAKSTTASTAFSLIHWAKNGMAIAVGKISEMTNWVEVAMKSCFYEVIRMKRGAYVHNTSGQSGVEGYFRVCTIELLGSYLDSPISITAAQRNRHPVTYTIIFTGTDNISEYRVLSFTHSAGNWKGYLAKTGDGVFDLYIQKYGSYDMLCVTDLQWGPHLYDAVTITWQSNQVSSLPASYTASSSIIKDYVTEYAGSGAWTYRKWYSGFVEMWGKFTVTDIPCTTPFGSLYRSGLLTFSNFPFTLQNTRVQTSFDTDAGGCFMTTGFAATSTAPPIYYVVRHVSTTAISGKVNIYVTGNL